MTRASWSRRRLRRLLWLLGRWSRCATRRLREAPPAACMSRARAAAASSAAAGGEHSAESCKWRKPRLRVAKWAHYGRYYHSYAAHWSPEDGKAALRRLAESADALRKRRQDALWLRAIEGREL